MKRKYTILLLMIFSFMFLVGWGKKSVELLNDKKLIDLNLAIERCIPGADAPDNNDTSDSNEEENNENNNDVTITVTPDDKEDMEEEDRTLVISVRNRKVTYETVEYTNMDKLKERIKQDNGERVTFKLVDDFAEAHVYKEVMSILSELESELGLKYSKD